jgi:hypothetical protein
MSAGLDLLQELPSLPNPSDRKLAKYDYKDWIGLFFEWHRTVGLLAVYYSFLLQESRALKKISRRRYIVLTALLSRISRLMMANLRMASEDRHFEAISIIDRSLHETVVKLTWLCKSKGPDRFDRYLAEGLKNDLQFRRFITEAARERGHEIAIETRMLGSIEKSIRTSGIAEEEIAKIKRLPTLETMMREAGFKDLGYIVVQRMGSHAVHGTWTGLLASTIDVDGAKLQLRSEFNSPHPNQLMFGSLMVLEAISAFCNFVIRKEHRAETQAIVERYRSKLLDHNLTMAAADFKPSSSSERLETGH